MRFERVDVTGGTPKQNAYIAHLFAPRHGCDTIGETTALKGYYRALSNDKVEALSPHAVVSDDSLKLFTLCLDTYIKKARRTRFWRLRYIKQQQFSVSAGRLVNTMLQFAWC